MGRCKVVEIGVHLLMIYIDMITPQGHLVRGIVTGICRRKYKAIPSMISGVAL